MLISYNWLKQYLNLPDSTTAEEVGEKLKASTVEVEAVRNLGQNLDKIVVGKIESVQAHPNADKLKICLVNFGAQNPVQIVCGGSNVAEGMLIALAGLGAKVRWHGEGELVELEKVKIRGVDSYGMICAATEIGLETMFPLKDEKEILDLTSYNLKPGTPLAEALNLNDAILEIENKSLSNRPDLWGHYGIAREVAVLLNKDLREYKIKDIEEGKDFKIQVKVADKKLCPRYMAVAISGVKIGPSPDWLKNRLMAVGINSINNIVDVTNYVMLDIGEPMHAFDASLLEGDKVKEIQVRLATAGEKIKALDGVEYELDETDLVIADSKKPLAVAGIIGGENSAISEHTNTIILEAANFSAINIRKTSTRLNIRTDSAQRFEKSLDPNLCEIALKKAVELILELCPEATVASAVVDESDFVLPIGPIEVNKDIFEKKIGVAISEKDIIKILEKLGFELKDKKDSWAVKIPTWRATKDVSLAEDLVEEVLRVFGYDKVPSVLPTFTITPPPINLIRKLERILTDISVREFAYTEIYNYSFISGEQIKNMSDYLDLYLELDNPLAKDRPYLRRHLIPNLLLNVADNISRNQEIRIFEIGKVFHGEKPGSRVSANSAELLPRQDVWYTAFFVNKKNQAPYWEVRRLWESIAQELKIDWQISKRDEIPAYEHPTRTSIIESGGQFVGIICEINPEVAKKFGVDYRVGCLQLNLNELQDFGKFKEINYQPARSFPEVERDVAFLVDQKTTHQEIIVALREIDPLLVDIKLFDVYTGEHVSEDKKSMAYRMIYYHPGHTLTSSEVERVHNKVLEVLKERFKAEIR